MTSGYTPPGRLGDPAMSLTTDPRAPPALIEAAKSMGLDGQVSSPYPDLSNMAELEKACREASEGFSAVYESLPADLPEDKDQPEVEQTVIEIDGVDGNKINLYVYKRKDAGAEPMPAVVYIRGGGMTILSSLLGPCVRWCRSLAALGTICVAVDFRNAWQPDGTHHPFPAGLNDCASAVQHLHAHKASLGISTLTLQGESGGANLCLATALKANREGWIAAIAGVYASAPYISNAYAWPASRQRQLLPSLVENDGYLLAVAATAGMARYYAPDPADAANPLAWPFHAAARDLRGLPPHVLALDELDPLRDEGVAYFRKLARAGVPATAGVSLGTMHASALIFRQALPDVHRRALRSVVAFARGL